MNTYTVGTVKLRRLGKVLQPLSLTGKGSILVLHSIDQQSGDGGLITGRRWDHFFPRSCQSEGFISKWECSLVQWGHAYGILPVICQKICTTILGLFLVQIARYLSYLTLVAESHLLDLGSRFRSYNTVLLVPIDLHLGCD